MSISSKSLGTQSKDSAPSLGTSLGEFDELSREFDELLKRLKATQDNEEKFVLLDLVQVVLRKAALCIAESQREIKRMERELTLTQERIDQHLAQYRKR